ncbi:putative mitochondrial DNA-directed RNA polymerase [Trypanosoma rangeli]|uniref:DNA-directed RNA polymerase n=1 Tax=Trypanosoma rangeli TaxID=5698 RepID=A0A3R7KH63_TRYRA|nr:putative mitochondrial DNA-directed RNA polymerase [Trypanosoma rangeli]RNF07576.1 putative mitochondrial DNA-directed RNA polymerase [Trypanosoma rangeli]|eukprot:RNF07576.1 putative mitochondrial DNA-directed RNA polymerase [Trypanosoma rangeli]
MWRLLRWALTQKGNVPRRWARCGAEAATDAMPPPVRQSKKPRVLHTEEGAVAPPPTTEALYKKNNRAAAAANNNNNTTNDTHDLRGVEGGFDGVPQESIDATTHMFTPTLDMEEDWAPVMAPTSSSSNEGVLSSIDMICDDFFSCKTDVLKSFARTRAVSGATKSELVMNLIDLANREAHGESHDLSITKRVLGDVFNEEVRVSGVRSQWTNKSLEASHVEMACDGHLKFEVMSYTQKTLMVRRNASESGRVLRKLIRPFQQDYQRTAEAAVGGVFRNFKAEADQLVEELPAVEVVGPFTSFLVSYVRYATSGNLLTRTNVIERLEQLGLVQMAVEDCGDATLQRLMALLDDVVAEVERRAGCFGDKRTSWGTETPEVLRSSVHAFADSWAQQPHGEVGEGAPAWVHDLVRMFNNWDAIVRTDIPMLEDVPRYIFDCILNGVVCFHLLQKVYGDIIVPTDVPLPVRTAVRRAMEAHFKDEEKAAQALAKLFAYVQAPGDSGVVKAEFFPAVLSQMQGAFHDTEQSALHNARVALVLREVCTTASRCTRTCGLFHMLVKITEDLRFHFRFNTIFKKLSGRDRTTIRTRYSINMVKTCEYFEQEFAVTPISTKAVGFLVIQLLHMSMRGAGSSRPILERFTSVTRLEEFSIVGMSNMEATQIRDLRVAFPPQLSYNSWLHQSDTKEKSVYNVLPSVAVKGSTNQAMIISQAPMMKALDAISRVPWRISKYMLHVQEAIVREGYGFGKIRPAFYPLHYCAKSRGDISYDTTENVDGSADCEVYNLQQRREYETQQDEDWKSLSEQRSNRIHYLQALRQARSLVQFSHIYFPNSMDFRGRMYPLPGRLNHTGSDPFRALLEYAEPKPLGETGLYWLKVHLANKMGMSKLSFDERVHYVNEHIEDVVRSAESPFHGDKWWQEAAEPMQCLMACKELADALKCSQGATNFLSRIPVAVDGSYNGLQHYSAIGRDAFGAQLVNLVPSERPADAYTGILREMMRSITADAEKDSPVAQRCLGTGKGQDCNHVKRKTIKRPIMTQVYGVTGYGMSEQILDELVKQNKNHGLWTSTDMREMADYLREKVLESLGITFRETQNCRRWITDVTNLIWESQPAELRTALCWTTPLGLVVRQPYKVRKEMTLFTPHGCSRVPGDAFSAASRKQLTAIAPNLIHSLDATHLAMTAIEMQNIGLSMMAVHDSYWTYACDLPVLSKVLRQQFVTLYSKYDPLWELKEQWEEAYFMDLRRHGTLLPDPPKRGDLDLSVVLDSPYFFS